MKRLFLSFLSVPLAVVTTMALGAAFDITSIVPSRVVKQCCTLGGNHFAMGGFFCARFQSRLGTYP